MTDLKHAFAVFAFVVAFALLALAPSPAEAEPRIQVGCGNYATNQVDPIAFSTHLHRQFGNTTTTNESTGKSLQARGSTSCRKPSITSAMWVPVEKGEPASRLTLYYRGPTTVKNIPLGTELLALRQDYRCGKGNPQANPPYGCKINFRSRVFFPNCGIREVATDPAAAANFANWIEKRGGCPSSHPYQIPTISYSIHHNNNDGVVPNPLLVSAGLGTYEPFDFMHGDYVHANQQPEFNRLLNRCLRSGDQTPPPECT